MNHIKDYASEPGNIRVLVAAEPGEEPAVLQQLLKVEGLEVFASTHRGDLSADCENFLPDVVVFAVKELTHAQQYLAQLQQSPCWHLLPPCTLLLCHRIDALKACELCEQEVFDSFEVFWPVHTDRFRLRTTVVQIGRARRDSLDGWLLAQMAPLPRLASAFGKRSDPKIQQILRDALADARAKVGAVVVELAQQAGREIEIQQVAALAQRRLDEEEAGACAPEPEGAVASGLRPRTRRLLVIEDDPFQQKIIRTILADSGLELDFARTGYEAQTALAQGRPDLILMDINLPDVNGIQLMREIKSQPGFEELPVIMLTGNSQQESVIESLRAGALGFLVKPVKRDTLLGKIETVLSAQPPSTAPKSGH